MTSTEKPEAAGDLPAGDFIRQIVAADCQSGKHPEIRTRFPPEPNGYLHIGHAKSICLNFGVAAETGGRCHLRFDDTNPERESEEYVRAIKDDVRWLGFDWGDHLYYASDYFERMYQCATKLIRDGNAYVCDLTPEQFKPYRGVPTRPGKESPHRHRGMEENLDLFQRMRDGEFPDGAYVLRAKIDMASPNLHLRDPALYRIKRAHHHRTGDRWCIYPTYDFAHGLEDSFEGITHSLCTLEFEVHRPLYDWLLDAMEVYHPRQIEFSRLNLSYTVMSKRKLLQLVEEDRVTGWDDPRMPTLAGLRRRGYTPASIRHFCRRIGVTKFDGITDMALLEHTLRDELNRTAPRVMAVLDPVKLVIDNYPEEQQESMTAINNPEDPDAGTRAIPFARELYIERDDFMEAAPSKFRRLTPGREVRLRYAYIVECTGCEKDADGLVHTVHCRYDPATRGGTAPDGRKVRGTIHWVPASEAVTAPVRLYDRLFKCPNPDDGSEGGSFLDHLNPHSLETVTAYMEPGLRNAAAGDRYQFERRGYFFVDPLDSRPGTPVFNRIVPLRDPWSAKEGGRR